MKFELQRASIFNETRNHLINLHNPFYKKEIIEETTIYSGKSYFDHYIELDTLQEFMDFINNLDAPVVIKESYNKDSSIKKTILIYDDYIE